MRIEAFPMGVFQVNTYVLTCEETGRVVVVDPGDASEPVVRLLRSRAAVPDAILNTHGHIDHVAGNGTIRAAFPDVPILMHDDDRFLVDGFEEQAALFGLRLPAPPPPDGPLVPGKTFRFGATALEIHFTPGHSPGHVALVHGRQAISGDVLFAGSIGRTDLPRGDLGVLLRSIDEVLVPMGDDLEIYPGHGPSTTIGEERRGNPFLQPAFRGQLFGAG